MKQRILQMTGSFLSGGSERQAATLAVGLKNEGTYDVRLATLNLEGPLIEDVRAAGFDDIPDFRLTSFYNANFLKQVRRCAAFLRENEIDLIHTHDFYTNVFGMAAAALAGTRVKIASKRETGGMRSRAQDAVERAGFNRADAIVVNADAVRDSLTRRGVGSDRISVIYNGLDLNRFAQGGAAGEEKLITLVANLRHEVKNVSMFIHTAKKVAERVPDAGFVIAGEGELADDLKNLAANLRIAERIRFMGRCDDVPALLASSYACVLTSNAEGFANAIIEYMAAGRPVVATDVGGAAEAVVEGETGYLVASGDSDAMADRLVTLLNEPDRAETMGAKGSERVRALFSSETQLAKTISLYNSLLS